MSGETDQASGPLKLAQSAFRRRNYEGAITHFKQAIQEDESNLRAQKGIAAAYFQIGELDKAVEHYCRVTQLDLRSGVPWINLGAVRNAQGDYQQAVADLRKGLAKEKRSAVGFYNLGVAHAALNQHTMAISGFKEAIAVDPEMIDAHLGLAQSYLALNNHQLAIAHFQKAVDINPESKRARHGLRQSRDAASSAKHSISPFGRLVDVNDLGPKSDVRLNRTLTQEEQIHDRHTVRSLATDVYSAAQTSLKQITEHLAESVLAVNRALAEGTSAPATVLGAYERFRDATQECFDLRRQLRRKIMEMRAHEEMVNAPDYEGFVAESSINTADDEDE